MAMKERIRMDMERKARPKVVRHRRQVQFSMSVEAVKILDDVSKSMGMTRSGFVEFMTRQIVKADKVPFGELIQETLDMYLKK